MTGLSLPGTNTGARALAVNESMKILVEGLNGPSGTQYFLYHDGGYDRVFDLINDPLAGLSITKLTRLNSFGDISGTFTINGVSQPGYLRAVPTPGTTTLGVLLLSTSLLRRRRG